MSGITSTLGDDGVAVVTIDRPEVCNALDWDAWQALADAFVHLDRDEVRAAVLTGGDERFSAGGDVKTMGAVGGRVTGTAARVRLAQRAVRGIVACRAPVIASVEGFALGAAWGLVLACDLVVASRDAFFAAPFAQRALVADAGLGWSLPRRLGQQRAARLLLLGERLPAEEAHTLGLVTHLADPGQALPDSLEVAGHLAAGPADSIALTKSLLHRGGHLSLDTYLDEEHLACALNGHGRDAAESRAAFLEKRAPRFTLNACDAPRELPFFAGAPQTPLRTGRE